MTTKRKTSRLTDALLETAAEMRQSGLLDRTAHDKITMRHVGPDKMAAAQPITGDEIRAVREQAQMSQAVFARHLNLTVGYVSQLERGTKRPTGAALALLNLIRRKGIDVFQ
jgi:putative transcriptional regulator